MSIVFEAVAVSQDDLAARRASWPGPRPTQYATGAIWKFACLLGGARLGSGNLLGAPPVVGAVSQVAVLMPAILTTIVLGPAILIFGAETGAAGGVTGALVLIAGAPVALTLPFVCQAVATSYASFPATLVEAAEVFGPIRTPVLTRVVMPMLLPGIVAAMTFSFLVSFDELVGSLFPTRYDMITVPALVLKYLRFLADPTIAAVSTMMSLVSLCLMLVADRVVGLDHILGLTR